MANRKQTKNTHISPEPAKPIETREQKLARLSAKRVTNALNKIRLIGNLAAYKPTDEQVDKICLAVATSGQMLEARLRAHVKTEESFTL